jgi:hypothetical protein
MRRVLAGVLLIVVALAAPASAHPQTTLDPDDSPGPLDLVAQRFRHTKSGVILRAVTYETWDDSVIHADPQNAIWFHLNLDDDAEMERCIRYPGEAGAVSVYRRCSVFPISKLGEGGSATRPDSHSVVIRVPKELLWKRMPRTVEWQALTSYEAEGDEDCPPPESLPPEHFYGTCTDHSDWATHRR